MSVDWIGKDGLVFGDHDVAYSGEAAAAPERRAMNATDQRDRQRIQRREHP